MLASRWQMVGDRCLIEGTGHTTPIEGLFLCGSSCHPGPGVTFLPGYNCAHEVMANAQAKGQTAEQHKNLSEKHAA